jgi:hypothetical protein
MFKKPAPDARGLHIKELKGLDKEIVMDAAGAGLAGCQLLNF